MIRLLSLVMMKNCLVCSDYDYVTLAFLVCSCYVTFACEDEKTFWYVNFMLLLLLMVKNCLVCSYYVTLTCDDDVLSAPKLAISLKVLISNTLLKRIFRNQ